MILCKIVDETDILAQILLGFDEISFLSSDEKMRATNMTLINIGEMVKNLSDDFRNEFTHIPWRKIAGFRDVAVHGYFTLRMDDVWIYASIEVPELSAKIKEILYNDKKTN